MVDIIVEDPDSKKKATCSNCASILQYTLSETREGKSYYYTGDCVTYTYIECPKCHYEVKVKGY